MSSLSGSVADALLVCVLRCLLSLLMILQVQRSCALVVWNTDNIFVRNTGKGTQNGDSQQLIILLTTTKMETLKKNQNYVYERKG